ncbi:MAG: hypothetical protein E6G36_02700 [Actinobacteria bacterium]|nr:MAG: hypothetical protein E6G36_02700 [Actinomycetota bacterium]
MKHARDPVVVACSLEQPELRERLQRWQALAERALIDHVASPRGLRLIFHGEPGVEEELHELATLERTCCAFADWSVRSTGEVVQLEIRGESEVSISAVEGMFGSFCTSGGDVPVAATASS